MLKSVVMKGLYLALLTAFFFSCQNTTPKANTWSSYHGGKDRNHYSKINEINPSNVAQLEPAWTFTTSSKGQMQMIPIKSSSTYFWDPGSFVAQALQNGQNDTMGKKSIRIMQFLGLIGLERCRSFGCGCSRCELEHGRINPELRRPQGR